MRKNLIQRCITNNVINLNPYCPHCLSPLHIHERIPQHFITKYVFFGTSFKRFKCCKCGKITSFPQPQINLTGFIPSADILEDKNKFEIQIALPGFKKSDLHISLQQNILQVSGMHNRNVEGFSRIYLWENSYGSFTRYFTLPENLDRENITAALFDGLLSIHLLKRKMFPEENHIKINIMIN